jgi:hypothetical protein
MGSTIRFGDKGWVFTSFFYFGVSKIQGGYHPDMANEPNLHILLRATPASIDADQRLLAGLREIPPSSGEPPTIQNLVATSPGDDDTIHALVAQGGRTVLDLTEHGADRGGPAEAVKAQIRATGDKDIVIIVTSDLIEDVSAAIVNGFSDVSQTVFVVERANE